MTSGDDAEPLMAGGQPAADPALAVNGRRLHPNLLECRPLRRCRVDECQSYCCSGGVYIHLTQVDDILVHQDLIIPVLPPERRDPTQWFDGVIEPDDDYPEAGPTTGTRVIDDPTHPAGTTCIFLLPDRRCALQAAGIAAGEHPWRFKPFYCALHPLVLDEGVLALGEQNEMYLDGGHCSRPEPAAPLPVYQLYDWETRLVLGDEGYQQLKGMAQDC